MDSQQFDSYVPVYDVVPEKWEESREFFVENLKKISNGINAREIGFYLDEEVLTGKQLFPGTTVAGNPPQFRSILRKVIDFGALPNAGIKSVPHGITFDNNFTLVHLYGSATNPSNNAIPLPFVHVNPTSNIQLYMDTTNVVIVNLVDDRPYSRCFIVIEYILEL